MPPGESTTTVSPPPAKSNVAPRNHFGGLVCRRVCLVPTWRGCVLLVAGALLVVILLGRQLCAFLSPQDSVPGGVLVIEGWVPVSVARSAVEEFRRNSYVGIYATGEPIEEGSPYIGFHSYA